MEPPPTVTVLAAAPSWWDGFAAAAPSPWNGVSLARLQERFGATVAWLAAWRGERPAGAAAVWFFGSRRFPFLDRLFARIAMVPDEPAVRAGDREAALALLDAIGTEIRRQRAVTARLRVELPRLLTGEDLSRAGYRVTERGVGVIELPEEETRVEALLRPPARRQARKAERLGVRVEPAPSVDPLLPLLDASFGRAGLPARNHDYVRALHHELSGEVLVASKDGAPVAALLWAALPGAALNVFHGRADGDIAGASDLLHREMFTRAVRRGVRLLHTGDAALSGESDERRLGITRFKRSMGFTIRPAVEGAKTLRPLAAALRRRLLSSFARSPR